MGDAMNFETF
jgi:hypothetical protein